MAPLSWSLPWVNLLVPPSKGLSSLFRVTLKESGAAISPKLLQLGSPTTLRLIARNPNRFLNVKEAPRIAGRFHSGAHVMRMWLAWERMDRVLRTILLLLISILLLSPIVYCGVSDNWHDQQRILQLVVLSGSSLLLLFSFPLPFARRMVQVTLLVILGLGSVSAFLSANPS